MIIASSTLKSSSWHFRPCLRPIKSSLGCLKTYSTQTSKQKVGLNVFILFQLSINGFLCDSVSQKSSLINNFLWEEDM